MYKKKHLTLGNLAKLKVKKLLSFRTPNYVDKFLDFFAHLPPNVDIFYGINDDKKSTFLDCLPPPLVNVVCERPLYFFSGERYINLKG